jgi:hypothetical protein
MTTIPSRCIRIGVGVGGLQALHLRIDRRACSEYEAKSRATGGVFMGSFRRSRRSDTAVRCLVHMTVGRTRNFTLLCTKNIDASSHTFRVRSIYIYMYMEYTVLRSYIMSTPF